LLGLLAQSSRKLNLWQACQEIGKKSSKIVPLGAPSKLGLCAASLFPEIGRKFELEGAQIVQTGDPEPHEGEPTFLEFLTMVESALFGGRHGDDAEVRDPVPVRISQGH